MHHFHRPAFYRGRHRTPRTNHRGIAPACALVTVALAGYALHVVTGVGF